MLTTHNQPVPTMLRLPQVMAMVGLKRSWIYERIRQGEFPAPIKLGPRVSVWMHSAIVNWIQEKATQSAINFAVQATTPVGKSQVSWLEGNQ